MPTTTYMSLVLPTPSSTAGPEWAELLNALQLLVDAHDHSDGKGTKVTQAGISITDALNMANQALSNIKQLNLASQASVSTPGALYRIGNNLWFTNSAGVAVQVTSGNAVNAAGSGDISIDTPGAYPYTVTPGDAQKILAIDTSAARTINLPAATTAMYFMLKDKTGSAQTNNISIVPDGTDTIENVNDTYAANVNFGCWGLISDGASAWYLV